MDYVNMLPKESQWDKIPADRPRHPTIGAAIDGQVEEGWAMKGSAVIVVVDDDWNNLGVA